MTTTKKHWSWETALEYDAVDGTIQGTAELKTGGPRYPLSTVEGLGKV